MQHAYTQTKVIDTTATKQQSIILVLIVLALFGGLVGV
jgi:hypothetical protein